MDLLAGQQLGKRFGERDVLDNVSIHIPQGSSVAIAGATGSGKSTLLKIMAGLMEPDHGVVLFRGKKVEGPLTKLIAGHEKIAYLSQHFELRNNYRVEEIFDYSNRLEDAQATELFELCELTHLLKRRTDQLSGGERQRIALARTLLTKPEVLLLDEPFSNLDLIQKTALKNVLSKAIGAFQLTTILVSHDPVDILSFAENIHIMQNGSIVQSGSPANIYYNPQDDYVAGLFGQYTFIDEPLRALFAAHQQPLSDNIHFLRPEMLTINAGHYGSMRGIIEDTSFTGPYWQAKVSINGYSVTCNYNDPSFRKGSRISVLLVK